MSTTGMAYPLVACYAGLYLRRWRFTRLVLPLGHELFAGAFVGPRLDQICAKGLFVVRPDKLPVLRREVVPAAAVGVLTLDEFERLGRYSPQIVTGGQMVETLFDHRGGDRGTTGRRRRLYGVVEE